MPSGSTEGEAPRLGGLIGLFACAALLSACRTQEPLPPVFGAVFGVSGAAQTPFTQGQIPEPSVGPGDRLLGAAAANPGSCIWRDAAGHRFRAACPEGSDGVARGS